VEYLTPLKEADVDTLIFGCTHYPLISPAIGRFMGSRVALIDPAGETALDARNILAKNAGFAARGAGGARLCFSADLARAKRFTASILGAGPIEFEQVVLQDYAVS